MKQFEDMTIGELRMLTEQYENFPELTFKMNYKNPEAHIQTAQELIEELK